MRRRESSSYGTFLAPADPKPQPEESTDRPRVYRREDLPADLQRALDVAVDRNARAPAILHVTNLTGYTDWVMLLSGRSDRHVQGIVEGITQELKSRGVLPRGTDGLDQHHWDLLDYDEFIIHVFYHPVRMHYDLESMWSDAVRVKLDLPAQVTDTSELDALDVPGTLPAYRGGFAFGGYDDEFDDDEADAED